MGEMVMKKLFERDGFVFAGLRGKQKKHDLCVTAAVLLFFVLSAYTFMNALYCLSDIIGSVVGGSADIAGRDALRTLPIFLTFLMSLAGLMAAHSFYRNESGAVLRKRARTHAAVGMGTGALLILYVAAGLLAGRYLSVAEGAPTPLYPLDTVLYALAVCGAGVLVFLYFGKNASAAPFAGPCRAPEKKKKSAGRRVGAALWLLLALYGFSGFFYSLFIVDLSDGYVPYSLALMLVLLITWLSVAVWEFYYNNLTARK